jgi:hypothetical protein
LFARPEVSAEISLATPVIQPSGHDVCMEPTYDVVWPQSPKGVEPRALAPRLTGLDGATIAYLWDGLFRGEELFAALTAELTRRHPTVRIVDWDVVGNTHTADEAAVIAGMADVLRVNRVDAVVSAVGA